MALEPLVLERVVMGFVVVVRALVLRAECECVIRPYRSRRSQRWGGGRSA